MIRIHHAQTVEFVQGYRSVKLPLEYFPQEERHTVIRAVEDMNRKIQELEAQVGKLKRFNPMR